MGVQSFLSDQTPAFSRCYKHKIMRTSYKGEAYVQSATNGGKPAGLKQMSAPDDIFLLRECVSLRLDHTNNGIINSTASQLRESVSLRLDH
jgi:hypothetical protein